MSRAPEAQEPTVVPPEPVQGQPEACPAANASPSDASEHGFVRVPSGEAVVLEERLQQIAPEQRGPLSGRLIQGRYLLKELLGAGGMGAVYHAEHTLMGKELAIKVLLPELGATKTVARRFQQEAQSASRLDHPGIIQVFDFGYTEEGMLFLAMAYLDGEPLTHLIAREAPLAPEAAIPLAVQILEALEHAHSQGVVHRDMKPDNVMVVERSGERRTKILDFGIARVTQGDAAAKGMTEAGMVFGTPEYLSPEQAAGDPADARADLYAVGVLLYELLAGRRPFEADTNVKYIFHHLHDPPPPLREMAPPGAVSPELERVVLRALAKSPRDRFQTAREFADALLGLHLVRYVAPGPSLTRIPVVDVEGGGLRGADPVARDVPASADPRAAAARPAAAALSARAAPADATAAAGAGKAATEGASDRPAAAMGGHDRPEVRQAVRRWGLVALGVLALGVVVLLIVVAGGDGGRAPPVQHHLTAEQRAELRRAETLVKAKHYSEAETRLRKLLRAAPRSPAVHLLLGHVQCLRSHEEACLGSYQAAVLLLPEAREDERLLRDLTALLRRTRGRRWGRPVREAAVLLATGAMAGAGPLGPRFRKVLVDWVNAWWEPDLVWKVIHVLEKQNAQDGVNYVHAYKIRFQGVRDCTARKRFISEIVARGDRALRKLLEEVYRTESFAMPYSKRRVSNLCLRPALAKAILQMGGEVPRLAPRAAPRARRAGPYRSAQRRTSTRRRKSVRGQIQRIGHRIQRVLR